MASLLARLVAVMGVFALLLMVASNWRPGAHKSTHSTKLAALSAPWKPQSNEPFAYLTLLTSDAYLAGLVTLAHSLLSLQSRYPLVVMAPRDALSSRARELIARLPNCVLQLVETIEKPPQVPSNRFDSVWTKLAGFSLTKYRRFVYVDCDFLVVKPLDELFSRAGFWAQRNQRQCTRDEAQFNAGLLVFEPNQAFFEEIQTGEFLARSVSQCRRACLLRVEDLPAASGHEVRLRRRPRTAESSAAALRCAFSCRLVSLLERAAARLQHVPGALRVRRQRPTDVQKRICDSPAVSRLRQTVPLPARTERVPAAAELAARSAHGA